MNFWEHFLHVLPYRPTHAIAAAYWHLTRRRVRARNRLHVASINLPFAYQVWIDTTEKKSDPGLAIAKLMKQWTRSPHFSIVLHGPPSTTTQQLDRSIRSIKRQIYPQWTLVEAPLDGFNHAIRDARGDFVVPLRAGNLLSHAALFRFAAALEANPQASILYGDQDQIDDRGRRTHPWFKPRWNEEMFLAQDYVGDAVAVESRLAREAASHAQNFDAVLLTATTLAQGPIVHIPHIICHAEPTDNQTTRLAAVSRHVEARGASCTKGPFGTIRVQWPLPDKLPLVSIIVPTRDRLDLLRPCIESIVRLTQYQNFEILIVDNDSIEPETAAYLREAEKDPRIRVISYPKAYNYSAINNFAVRHANGSFLCLLNNDTEVTEPEWLSEMMRYAVKPGIGAVGAKLLYEDGSIQHAGVVVGIGEAAGHAHRFLRSGDPGYFRQPHVTQFVSAVTAACLVVEQSKFAKVGGLDETGLAIAFNDVDLCLKLESAGWRNVYVPHAVLLHHETKSRGKDTSPRNIERYRRELNVLQTRWGTKSYQDPLHNPNLDRYSETFVFRL